MQQQWQAITSKTYCAALHPMSVGSVLMVQTSTQHSAMQMNQLVQDRLSQVCCAML